MADRTFALSLLGDWLGWLERSRGRDPKTVRAYREIVYGYLDWLGDRPLDGVTSAQIERWLQRPRFGARSYGQVAAPATQRRDAGAIRGFYGYAVDRGVIRIDPSRLVSTPTVRNRLPRPLADETWLRLWAAVEEADARLLGLGFFGGLRREEMTRLRVSHVDVSGRRIVNFIRKGGGEDVLPLGTILDVFDKRLPHLGAGRLWPLIEEAAQGRDGDEWLVGWSEVGRPTQGGRHGCEPGQLHPQHLNKWLEGVCRRAGVEHVNPHRLRHSCATNLLRAGVPLPYVSSALNHASISTTMRYIKSGGDGPLREWLDGQV